MCLYQACFHPSAGPPLFEGYDWVSGVRTEIADGGCGVSGQPRCDFPLVVVRLRAIPEFGGDSGAPFELIEEVRLRNA